MADQGNDECIWVSAEASIRCTHKAGSSNALTTFSNLPDNESDGMGNFAITVKEETNKEEAVAIFRHQQLYNHPTVLGTHYINKTESGQIITVTERVPSFSFQQWLNKPGLKHWEMGVDGTRVVGLSDEARKVLKQVGDCLKTMMFTRNQFHGYLEEGIRVSTTGDVKVVMMNPCQVHLTNFEFEEGIKNDIGLFKGLVEKIEVVTPVDGPRPSFFILFHLLCDIALSLSGKALRDVAYFIYANAAFYNDEEKIKLIFKLWDFFETNIDEYEALLLFTEAPVDMRNWQQKLYEAGYEALLKGYQNNKESYFKKAFGIFKYHKNTLEHFSKEVVNGPRHRPRLLPTMRLLSEAFPEFIPKLFYLVATKIREREADFGEQDALTGNIVDNDLVLFLRNGRDALP